MKPEEIVKPQRVSEQYWDYFVESLNEKGIEPVDQDTALLFWQGFMLGYEKAAEHEGYGADFFER